MTTARLGWLGTIWIAPRATMRRVIDGGARGYVLTLTMIGGLWSGLNEAAGTIVGEMVPLFVLLGIIAVAGPAIALAKLFIGGWLVSRIGRWYGGQARTHEARAALAWGSVPFVTAGAVWLALLPVYRGALFEHAFDATPSLLYAAAALLALGSVWSVLTTIKCVAEAHAFSAWRALLNVIMVLMIVGLLVVVPFLVLVVGSLVVDRWGGVA